MYANERTSERTNAVLSSAKLLNHTYYRTFLFVEWASPTHKPIRAFPVSRMPDAVIG